MFQMIANHDPDDKRICPLMKGECIFKKCKFYVQDDSECLFGLLRDFLHAWEEGEAF